MVYLENTDSLETIETDNSKGVGTPFCDLGCVSGKI